MADRNGYIGRAPSDSSVIVARQTFSPTGVTTDFTFSSGYTVGYFDIFINGVKMIEGSDYTSTNGLTFSVLNGGVTSGDVIEGVAYKAFNLVDGKVGILSAGSLIGNANNLNFVGTGNTFLLNGTTVDIAISGGGGGAGAGGTWSTNASGIHTTKNVGIGTILPTGNLEVSGNDGVNISNATRTGSNGAQWRFIPHNGGAGESPTNLRLYEGAGATEVINITKTGLIGVNTMAPGTLLELKGESSKEATVTFNRQPVQGTNDGIIGQFLFENATDSVALLAVKRESALDDAYIQFATQPAGGGLTERLRIDSNGRLLLGATSHSNLIRLGQAFAVATTDQFGGGSFTGFNGTTASEGPVLDLQRSRATTKSPGTVVASGDRLGSLVFRGDDGTDFADAAFMLGEVDGTPNGGFVPGRLTFYTGTTSAVPAERLRISSAGNVGIGENSPYYKLHLKTDNSATSLSGGTSGNWGSDGIRIENSNNTAGSLSLAHFRNFDADWHIGSKYVASNISDFVFFAEGNEKLRILSDGTTSVGALSATPGTIAAGSLVVTNSNAGFFSNVGGDAKFGSSDNNNVIFQVNGAEKVRIATSGQIGLGGANYGTSGQVLTSNGSASAPSWQDTSGGITTEAFTSSGIVTAVRLGTAVDHKITATGITTITSSGSGTEGESHTIRIVNSGIATVGFSTYFLFPSGSAPSLPTADGAISLISFTVHDSVGAGCTQLLAGASVNFS